ncbi:hypothetical protein CHUAL_012560 [Chamberlinius hualienensis]
MVMISKGGSFFALFVLINGLFSTTSATLCNDNKAIVIEDEDFFDKRWYLQIMQNYPIEFSCLWTSINKDSLTATGDFLTLKGESSNGDVPIEIQSDSGTIIYFPSFPNLVYQLVYMTKNEEITNLPESYAGLLCNRKLNVSIFAIFTTKRDVPIDQLLSLKVKANLEFPQLAVQLFENDIVVQQNCSN